MGWGKNPSGFSRSEAKKLKNNSSGNKQAQQAKNARQAAANAEAQKKAAKTEDKSAPSHYTQGGRHSGHTRRAERHHGED